MRSPHLARLLVPACLLVAAACGGSSTTTTGTGTVVGTLGSAPFGAVGDVVTAAGAIKGFEGAGVSNGGAFIALQTLPSVCDSYVSDYNQKNNKLLELVIFDWNATDLVSSTPTVAGTYTVADPNAGTDGYSAHTAFVFADQFDGVCADTSTSITTGTVTLTAAPTGDGKLVGTFDLTDSAAHHLTGTFSGTVPCQAALTNAGGATTVCK